jgi:hypothetical protein
MIPDIRPVELRTVHSEKTTHRLEITHKKTGIRVSGTGPNRYALECSLLELLSEKMTRAETIKQQSEGIPCLK